jgi:hypothetical protein
MPLELAIIAWGEEGKEEEPKEEVKEEIKTPFVTKKEEVKTVPPSPQIKPSFKGAKEVSEEVWRTILAQVKPINTSIEALLRAARPVNFDGMTLTLGVYYRFHKERLEEGNYRRILEDVVAAVLGTPVRVVCTLTEPPVKKVVTEEKKENVLTEGEDKDIIKIAEEIFGN